MAPKKVLIVDDMPDAIEFLPDWLRREGYETLLATRGQQALALAEEARPDAILLDVTMPGMDGIETCRRLRMNPATSDIPVILVSARSPTDARAEGISAGAADYITKPIDFPDLLGRLERLIDARADAPPDHRRLLEEMAYTALAVLPCSLAWLLVVDGEKRWLVSRSVVLDRGAEAARLFLSQMKGGRGLRFPLVHGDNPLSEVVLSRKVLINVPVERFPQFPGGIALHRAFAPFGLVYVSVLPLVSSGRVVGALVLGTLDAEAIESRRGQQIVNSLSSQAAITIDNARLVENLARREARMQAEQAFREMVLDTMGEGLVVVDEEATITYVNTRLLRMTNYTREMLYGRSVGLIFHPANRDRLVLALKGQRRDTLSFAQRLFTKDGGEVPVLLSRAVAPSPDGKGSSTVIVVTDLSELHRNEEALQRQTQRVQAINRAANAISSASSLDEVVRISLEAALYVVQGVSASILLRDPDQPATVTQVAAIGPHLDAANRRVVAQGTGLVGQITSTAASQLVTNVKQQPEVLAEYTGLYGSELNSIVAVPLVAFDEVIGVVEVVNKQTGLFDRQDVETLESLAGSAAITIENARLFDQARRRVAELSTLLDASAAVTSTLDFGDILERIARRLSMALRVDRVVILDRESQSDHLISLAEVVNAYWSPAQGPLYSPDALPVTGVVLRSSERVIVPDRGPEDAAPAPDEFNASGLRAVAAFPITILHSVVGVVTLYAEAVSGALPQAQANAVSDVIARWQGDIGVYDAEDWLSRPNLTDLCQRVLQASMLRWCAVQYRDDAQHGVRLAREIGYALWLKDTAPTLWDTQRFPSLARALSLGELYTLHRDDLPNDPDERAYLYRVGGTTCLLAPLFIRGEPGGLVKLIDSRPERRVFDPDELSLCRGIANVVGNAMENAHLYTAQEQRATALAAAYQELQSADEMKDDLLQNLSHELRTPLTHILGYLRLMLDGAFGELTPEQTETITLVTNKAEHLTTLVQDIVSVQEADARVLEPKSIHLERVVALAVRHMAGKAQAKDVRIVPRIPTNLPAAYADPAKVGGVFEELLENAIKFSPPSSQIELTLDDPGGLMLHACVRDYGIGIAPEEHEKIFRRFYQVDSGTTRRYGGTGLGLTVVKQVVEGHSGRVWVESELGKGSTFHLTLPKASAIADPAS